VVHGLWQHPGVAARRALRAAGVPYFVYPHGMLDPWFRHEYPLKHAKKCLYWWLAQHAVLRDAAAVLFTCEEERRLARESFWPYRVREAVVNYGTTLPAGVRPEQRDAFLAAFPALRGQRLLLFLGRIHEKKGCDLLIDAFAEAAAANRRCTWSWPARIRPAGRPTCSAAPPIAACPDASPGPACCRATSSGVRCRRRKPSCCPRIRRTSALPWPRRWPWARRC